MQNEKLKAQKEEESKLSLKTYIFSRNPAWYWIILSVLIATIISVLLIDSSKSSFLFLRLALSATFISVLPGYVLIRLLFPDKTLIRVQNNSDQKVQRFALSMGISFIVVAIDAFVLNNTIWGITAVSIVSSLAGLTIIFATMAVIREWQIQRSLI